jgi:cellobiose-specific phosphotransferase system component IIB
MAEQMDVYSTILESKLQPLYSQWDQARQQQQQQIAAIQQKYESPEARQKFDQQVADQINRTYSSFIQNAVSDPFVQGFYSRTKKARQVVQDVVDGKYPPGSRVTYEDPERGFEVGVRLSLPGVDGKPYPEDIFLAQQKLGYFNQVLTNPKTGREYEFNPSNMDSVPDWVLQNAFRQLGDVTGLGQTTTWEGHGNTPQWRDIALRQLGEGLYNQISPVLGESVGRQQQAEIDAFTRNSNRENMGFQSQIDTQARTLGPQVQQQLDQFYQKAQTENVPFSTQDILGAFDLAPKTPVSNFLSGNITAQQLQQPTTQAAQAAATQTAATPAAQPAAAPTAQAATQTATQAATTTAPTAAPQSLFVSEAVTQPQPTAQPAAQPAASLISEATPVATPSVAATPVSAPTAPATTALTTMAQPMAQPTTLSQMTAGGIPTGIGGQQALPQTFLTGTATQPTGLTPERLPALRGAAVGGQSAIDPTLRPYLELGLRGAEQLFLQQAPSLYPGQMYVSPSQQTLDALAQQEAIARAPSSALQAAQESYMAGLGGLGFTAGGGFLGSNPFQQRAIEAATRPITQQFERTTLPGIASQFSAAGRYGSGAMGRITGEAQESASRALGDVAANIAYTDYARERGLQNQAIGAQMQAATIAPQIYGQQFLPSQQLGQVGAIREEIARQPLQEAIQRYQFQQQLPYQQLSGFLSSVYGTPLAGSQYQTPAQAQTNRAGNVLGLASTAAGIGNIINPGGTGALYGAGLGALAGLLG